MFITRGLGAGPIPGLLEEEEATPRAAVFTDSPLTKDPAEKNVPALKESQLAQRIYNLHQKRKVSRKAGLETEGERRRFQEYAKFLMAHVSTYAPPNGRLRPDVAANLLGVVRETPGMMPGIGLVPVVIFGLALRALAWGAGFFFGIDLLSTIEKNLSVDEQKEDARLALIQQGRSADEIKKIMDGGAPPSPGFLSQIGDLMQYALWGGLAYVVYKLFLEKKFNRPRRRRRA